MNTVAPFNVADLIAAIVVLVCIVLGFRRGLVGQIMPIVTLIVIAAAVRFGYAPCRDGLTRHLDFDPSILRFGALVIVIAAPLAVMILLRTILGEVVKLPFISGIDRLGGALAGLIVGAIVVLVVFVVLNLLPERHRSPALREASWIGRHVARIEEDLAGAVSQRVDRVEGAILKARADRTGRREQGEP